MIVTSFRTRAAICAAGAAAVAALTAGTAIAGADANDDAFAAAVKPLGITGEPTALRTIGLLICGDLINGKTPDQISAEFETSNNAAVIAAAKSAYCPWR
jgi:uncharacterized protein DUF732